MNIAQYLNNLQIALTLFSDLLDVMTAFALEHNYTLKDNYSYAHHDGPSSQCVCLHIGEVVITLLFAPNEQDIPVDGKPGNSTYVEVCMHKKDEFDAKVVWIHRDSAADLGVEEELRIGESDEDVWPIYQTVRKAEYANLAARLLALLQAAHEYRQNVAIPNE